MIAPIRHDHEVTLEALLSGKLPRNLPWSEALEVIEQVGSVKPHGENDFTFSVGTQEAFFNRPHGKDLEIDDVSRLRSLLHLGLGKTGPPEPLHIERVVVIVDHRAARLFLDLGGKQPQHEATVKPHDPNGFHRHLVHRKEAHYRGERIPEETSFYQEIAAELVHAQEIVLVGHGTGKSSAVNFLAHYLELHRPEIFKKVVSIEIADLSALTESGIEEIAMRHFLL